MGLSDNLRNIEAEIAAGRPEQALTLCLELQTRYPRALALQRVLGETYLALRKPREALGALDRALAGNPEDARACCARAIVQQIHGDAPSALKWYRRACDITPDDQVLRSAYRELASSQGQPAYRPTRLGLARLYLRGDLLSHAIREWESLLAEEPDSLEVQVGLAETLWRAERFQPATDRCERILSNAPSCVKAILILAIMEHDTGHPDVAERLVRRTADLDPDCRIGQLLCADRLAAGDQALQALFFKRNESAAARDGVASHPLNTQGSANVPNNDSGGARTRFTSQPLPEPAMLRNPSVKSQPLGSRSPQPGSPIPEQQRGNTLPANFRNIFAETEYMLWGREADDSGEAYRTTPLSPGGSIPNISNTGSREDQFARSNVFVPPGLRDQGVNMDDTEARASINFVNWLQAQGALQQDAVPIPPRAPVTRHLPSETADAAATFPITEQLSTREYTSAPTSFQAPVEQTPPASTEALAARYSLTQSETEQSWEHSLLPSAPVAGVPSKSEDLRRMFAELGDQTGAHRAAEGQVAADQQFTSSGFHGVETGAGDAAPTVRREPGLLLPEQEAEPSDHPARLERARQRRSAGQIDQALADYRLVLKNAPDLLADVMEDLNESLEEAPEHPEVHRLLGDAYIRQGNYLQALEAYNRAVALTQAQDGS
ncbi:MAG: tetratricopeptide repeat protein [Ktedonobacterales bacterium]